MNTKTIVLLLGGAVVIYMLTRPTNAAAAFNTGMATQYGPGGYPLAQYRNKDAEVVGAIGSGLSGLITAIGNAWNN